MKTMPELVIVDADVLPPVFLRVLEAKQMLEAGKALTVQEAVAHVGISRSAFYKYRDSVFPFYENTRGRTITFAVNLLDEPGHLSRLLQAIAEASANILTIHQTIPLNKMANVTFTIELANNNDRLFDAIRELPGVQGIKILGRE